MKKYICKKCSGEMEKTSLECPRCGATHYNGTVTYKNLFSIVLPGLLFLGLYSYGKPYIEPAIAEIFSNATHGNQVVNTGRSLLIEKEGLDNEMHVVASKTLWSGNNDQGNESHIIKYAYKDHVDYADSFLKLKYVAYYIDGDNIMYNTMDPVSDTDQQMVFIWLAKMIHVDIDKITPVHPFYKIETTALDF